MKHLPEEGSRESVYLAQDALLDKKVAFPSLKRLVGVYPPESVSQFNPGEIAGCCSASTEENPAIKRPVRIN